MDISPIKAVQAPYYGDNSYRTPPPDLPSLLLKERIVYLGMPLVPAVTELIVAQLLYLQSDDPDKPIKIYINSNLRHPVIVAIPLALKPKPLPFMTP